MSNDWKPESAVYTPQQAAKYGLEQIDEIRQNQAASIALGVPSISDYFAPVRPGQITFVQAQTHQYKSGFCRMWARLAAEQLNTQERFGECIVHVSVEECIEEQAFQELAHYSDEEPGGLARGNVQDWTKLKRAAIQVGKLPIYRIGDSLARPEDLPNLYLSNIIRSIQALQETQRKKPAAIFVDYLQALPIDPEVMKMQADKRRHLQVRQDVYRLRQASVFFKAPVIVAVQAKQTLQGAQPPIMIPGMYDGQDTSAIAQRADRIISLWMPKVTHAVGQHISAGNYNFTVSENQLWVKVVKQRGGLPSGKAWPCIVDYRSNTIRPDLP